MRTLLLFSVVAISIAVTLFQSPALAAPGDDLWDFWDESNAASQLVVDHSRWTAFLGKYVHASDSGINTFAYSSVVPADHDALQAYIARLASTDPRRLRKDEQLAYWINLYNALTVDVVLNNPKDKSIKKMGRGLFSSGPWDDELVSIVGESLTLNDIEHRILRPIWQDHRIHYAVNCASVGCPNLATQAYTADNVNQLLSDGERDYVNHHRGVHFDEDGRLTLSKIYQWYGSDFANDERGVLDYLGQHHEVLATELAAYSGDVRYNYDWSLNQTANETD